MKRKGQSYLWYIRWSMAVLIFLIGCQSSVRYQSDLIRSGYKALYSGDWQSAESLFERQLLLTPSHAQALSGLAFVYYEQGKKEAAKEILDRVSSSTQKSLPDLHYYMGRMAHDQHQFKEAASYYKNFIREADSKHPKVREVFDQIKRAHVGYQLSFQRPIAILTNLDLPVNTKENQWAPILSPNDPRKIYFNSNAPYDGGIDAIAQLPTNMFQAEQKGGQWGVPESFLTPLNLAADERLLSIQADGSALLFGRSQGGVAELYMQKVTAEGTQTLPFVCPVRLQEGDKDVFLVNDSILIFSSNRLRGKGGYDLYYSFFKDGLWSDPVSMDGVNSPYDDIAPFLSNDGRTLYFSSNRPQSMGGYDVFKTYFSEKNLQWTSPENIGMPINSASDDIHFHLASDGKRFILSSNRIGTIGGYDLYMGTLRETATEQLVALSPFYLDHQDKLIFGSLPVKSISVMDNPGREVSSGATGIPTQSIPNTPSSRIEYDPIESLYFRESETKLGAAHQIKLGKIIEILQKHPEIAIEVRSHLPKEGNQTFQIFASLEQASWVANYIMSNGISSERVVTKAYGSQYPAAKYEVDNQPNASAAFMNRRIDFEFHQVPEHVSLSAKQLEISPFLQDKSWYQFQDRIKGLSYKIQFVSLRSMYSGDLMEQLKDPSIERQGSAEIYQYNVGLVNTFREAHAIQKTVAEKGFKDAFIVVYINGQRRTRSQINETLVTKYPDLRAYMRATE